MIIKGRFSYCTLRISCRGKYSGILILMVMSRIRPWCTTRGFTCYHGVLGLCVSMIHEWERTILLEDSQFVLLLPGFVSKVQCGTLIKRSIFSKFLTIDTPYLSTVSVRYGVFYACKPQLVFPSVTAVMYLCCVILDRVITAFQCIGQHFS